MAIELLGENGVHERQVARMESPGHENYGSDFLSSGYAMALEIAAKPTPAAAVAAAARGPGVKTILLVEDEAFLRQAIAEALQSAGYRLLVAGSGDEALKVLDACLPAIDLLLTDLVMPGISGCRLATAFEDRCPHGQVLLMTGHAEQFDCSERWQAATNYLIKPFSVRTLLEKVRESTGQFNSIKKYRP